MGELSQGMGHVTLVLNAATDLDKLQVHVQQGKRNSGKISSKGKCSHFFLDFA